jgi:Na+-driven multidrug efflux pump/anti-sigma regulatory factor (Ser/Thr protein kinase)
MATRNKYLTNKAFNIYLGASILTALSSMLGNIVDSIIVSNMIAPDAMSAVSLARPLIQLYYTVYLLIGLGGSLLVAFAIGKNDNDSANRTFSVVIEVLAIFTLLTTIVGICCPNAIVGMFCSNAQIYGYAMDYFRPVLWGCVFYMGSFFLGTYTTIDGAPKLVSLAMITDNVCNLCFDIVLIKYLDMGTAGSSIASNIGHAVGIAIMASRFVRGKSAFRLMKVKVSSAWQQVGTIARSGAPFAVASICLTVYMYLANIIIQDNFGANGIYIFSVMLSLLTFYNFFLSGACSTLQSLGALLVGMDDMNGLRMSVNAAFRFLLVSLSVCCGILWIVPGAICSAFGCPESLLAECCYACRIYAVAFMLFSLIYLLMVNYKLLKHEALSNFLSFALSLTVIPVIWVIAIYFPSAIWWSNLLAYVIVLAVAIVWSQIKRKDGMSFLTLLPTKAQTPMLDISVGYSEQGLAEAMTNISEFLEQNSIDQQRGNAIKLSTEELLKNIIQYAHAGNAKRNAKAFIDIRMSADDKTVKLSLRDDGRPFNPTASKSAGGYGLLLSTAFGQKLSYKYMFGQNITIVEI